MSSLEQGAISGPKVECRAYRSTEFLAVRQVSWLGASATRPDGRRAPRCLRCPRTGGAHRDRQHHRPVLQSLTPPLAATPISIWKAGSPNGIAPTACRHRAPLRGTEPLRGMHEPRTASCGCQRRVTGTFLGRSETTLQDQPADVRRPRRRTAGRWHPPSSSQCCAFLEHAASQSITDRDYRSGHSSN